MSENLYLVAHVADRGLLVDAARVDSVVELSHIAPAPGSAAEVRGLAAIRSRIATVIDTRRLLGLPDAENEAAKDEERAIVVSVAGHLYAVLVDALADVAPFTPETAPAGVARRGGWQAMTGVVEREGETMIVLDLDRLLTRSAS